MSDRACLVCERAVDGRLRASLWEEEEKGRIAARSAPLCADCHARFLAGELDRVALARAAHRRRGYEPAGWIERLDRDALLDAACLSCGVILDLAAARDGRLGCRRCGAVNRLAERKTPAGPRTLTAEVEPPSVSEGLGADRRTGRA